MDELSNSIDAYARPIPDDIVCEHAGWQEPRTTTTFDSASKKRSLRSRIVHDERGWL